MARGEINLGAPILDSSIAGSNIVTNGIVVKEGFEPIVLTPTETNTDGQTTTTTASSSAPSGSSASTSTYRPDVKTGTHKAYSEFTSGQAVDHFENMKFAKEEKKVLESKTKAAATNAPTSTIAAQKQQVQAEEFQVISSSTVIFAGVIGAILAGILIFGMMYVKKRFFTHPAAEKLARATELQEHNGKDDSMVISELPVQFDPTREINSASKLKSHSSDENLASQLTKQDDDSLFQTPSEAPSMQILMEEPKTPTQDLPKGVKPSMVLEDN